MKLSFFDLVCLYLFGVGVAIYFGLLDNFPHYGYLFLVVKPYSLYISFTGFILFFLNRFNFLDDLWGDSRRHHYHSSFSYSEVSSVSLPVVEKPCEFCGKTDSWTEKNTLTAAFAKKGHCDYCGAPKDES